MESKECPKCGKTKQIEDFHSNRSKNGGKCSSCKECTLKTNRDWRKNNKEKCHEISRRWRAANPGRKRELGKRWAENNPEKVRKTAQHWKAENPEKVRAIWRRWCKNNPDRKKENGRIASKKIRGTPKGKLNSNLSTAVSLSLGGNKKGRHWEELVGYTIEQLKLYLEKKFTEGMTWGNYGKWHIDHIIPISAFNFEKAEDDDFKRCWALKNLQPLWAADNLSKKDTLEKQFQPSLIF